MHRTVYLILTSLIILLYGLIPYSLGVSGEPIGAIIGICALIPPIALVGQLLLSLIWIDSEIGMFNNKTIFIGLFTLKHIKINHQIGNFYMTRHKDKVTIFKQGYFCMVSVTSLYYNDIPDLEKKLKRKLDKIYAKEIKEKEDEEKRKEEMEKWDKCLDKQSRREHKLKKIL